MTITGEFSGLSGTLQNGHIHGPAPEGQSTGVMYGFLNFMTPGADNMSGTINATIPLVDGTRGFNVPTQIEQLNSGQWYFNIHSSTFTGGEIRGQILVVPEPSTMALSALALGGLLVWRIRRKQQ